MSGWADFFDGFLDGFVPGGFLGRSRPPSGITHLFAAEPERHCEPWEAVTFEPVEESGQVAVAGDLHSVPGYALHGMIDLLKREEDSRNTSSRQEIKAGYGAQR